MLYDLTVQQSRGRPSAYSEKIAAEVCERLAAGESLRAICRDGHMPPESTIRGWAIEDYSGFSARYARAREIQTERYAEEILQIADADYTGPDGTTDNALIQQARLRVDSRKWLLSKMLPKRYGDRVGIDSTGSLTVKIIRGLGDE